MFEIIDAIAMQQAAELVPGPQGQKVVCTAARSVVFPPETTITIKAMGFHLDKNDIISKTTKIIRLVNKVLKTIGIDAQVSSIGHKTDE